MSHQHIDEPAIDRWASAADEILDKIYKVNVEFLSYLKPEHNIPHDLKLAGATNYRKALINLVNNIDKLAANILLFADNEFPNPCPDSCPGQPTPTPTSMPLKPAVSEQSIMTDLTLTNFTDKTISATVPSDNSMALDPPASPTLRPTYASVASRPKAQAPKAPVLNPVRLVVRPSQTSFKAKPFAMILINGPAEPFRRLTLAFSLSPSTKDVKLLGVHVNRSQNLIVSLPHGTSEATVSNVITVIHSCFSTLVCFPLLITQDVAWTKFMVSSVPSRLNPGAPTYSEEEVKTSFLLNPAVQALSIMRPPRWIRNPASITGTHSSFTFSFVDPDGSLGRSLAKSRLFTFGKPVHLKRWTDKPRQTRGANSN